MQYVLTKGSEEVFHVALPRLDSSVHGRLTVIVDHAGAGSVVE